MTIFTKMAKIYGLITMHPIEFTGTLPRERLREI